MTIRTDKSWFQQVLDAEVARFRSRLMAELERHMGEQPLPLVPSSPPLHADDISDIDYDTCSSSSSPPAHLPRIHSEGDVMPKKTHVTHVYTSSNAVCGQKSLAFNLVSGAGNAAVLHVPSTKCSTTPTSLDCNVVPTASQSKTMPSKFVPGATPVRPTLPDRSVSALGFDNLRHLHIPSRFRKRARTVVLHPVFEAFSMANVVVSCIIAGLQADYMARHMPPQSPIGFVIGETLCTVFFCFEVLARISVDHWFFFMGPGRLLNRVDFLVVLLEVVGVIAAIIVRHETFAIGQNDVSFAGIQVLRLVRIIRVARTAKPLRWFAEVRSVVMATMISIRPLVAAMFVLLIIIYSFALVILEVAQIQRRSLESTDRRQAVLELHYGTLGRALMVLLQSVTGGVDWNVAVEALPRSGMAVCFLCGFHSPWCLQYHKWHFFAVHS